MKNVSTDRADLMLLNKDSCRYSLDYIILREPRSTSTSSVYSMNKGQLQCCCIYVPLTQMMYHKNSSRFTLISNKKKLVHLSILRINLIQLSISYLTITNKLYTTQTISFPKYDKYINVTKRAECNS